MDPIPLKLSDVSTDEEYLFTLRRSNLERFRSLAEAFAEEHPPITPSTTTTTTSDTAQTNNDATSSASSRSLAAFWKSKFSSIVDNLLAIAQQMPVLRPRGRPKRTTPVQDPAEICSMYKEFARSARRREYLNNDQTTRRTHRQEVIKINKRIHGGNCVLDAQIFQNDGGFDGVDVAKFKEIYSLTTEEVLDNYKNQNMVELANKLGSLWLDKYVMIAPEHALPTKMVEQIEKHMKYPCGTLHGHGWHNIEPRYNELLEQANKERARRGRHRFSE